MSTDEDLMADFLESVSYSGQVKPWREEKETGASEDEPDDGMPTHRSLSRATETLVHAAADAHVPAIKKIFATAFKHAASKIRVSSTSSPTVAMKLAEPALQAMADSLRPGLEAALLACLEDGGQAAMEMLGTRALAELTELAEWDESEHPRDEHGQFSSDGSESSPTDTNTHLSVEAVQQHAVDVALKLGFDPTRIDVVDENPRKFTVGDKQFLEAGHYSPSTGRIQLNSRVLTNADVEGVTIHEIQHAQYDHVKKVMEQEHKEINDLIGTEDYRDPNSLFRRSGYPRPEKLQEVYDRFPASAAFAKTWGDAYLGGPLENNGGLRDQMEQEDGHTTYAKSYWHPEALNIVTRHYNGRERALDETLAETVRYQLTPEDKRWTGDRMPKYHWRRLAADIQQAYKLVKNKKVTYGS
jgi:DnaJ-domain-containing protein 1